jgi:Ca-activated chloride channel family protein
MNSPSLTRSTHNNEISMGLCALDGTMLALKRLVAKGKLRNELLEMSVEQHYQNSSAANVEAVYTFPLMPDVVLLGLELIIGDRHLFGVSVPVVEARHSYEQALEDGNSAVMLEKATDGLYTVNIGNLLAGESACIRYQYAQPIGTKNGTMRITIPTTVPPRYGNSAAQLQPHQVPESDVVAEYPFSLSVHIEGESNPAVITSPTHETTLSRAEDGLTINFPAAYLDRDAVIMVKRAQQATVYLAETSAGCIAYAPVAATLPGLSDQVSAMSLRIVIDCSGSMEGESIKSARRGAMRALESLTETDEYSISRFGSTFEHFDQRLTKAVASAKAQALRYLEGTEASLGGTEMASALAAVSQLAGAATHTDVLLVTDGEIWAIDELVASAQRAEMRYFIVGVGFSPSHDNLLRLAEATGGAYVAVTPGEDIEQAIEALLARLQQPRIGATRLSWPIACQWQTRLSPTLFKHEAVAVFAGLSAMPEGESAAVLKYSVGGSGDGHRIDEPLSIKPWAGDPTLLLRVATAMRIRELESNHQTSQLLTVAEATRLAVEHNLVSSYTNYLVVMERADADKPLDLPSVVTVKQMAPTVTLSACLDIPMFSRQQVIDKLSIRESSSSFIETVISNFRSDKPTSSFELALNKRMGERNNGVVPTRIAVLVRLGLDDEIVDLLHQLVRDGADESETVFALLLLLADVGQLDDLSAANLNIVKELSKRISEERLTYLQRSLRDVVEQRA